MSKPYPLPEKWIESSLKTNGHLPTAEQLSLWSKITLEEAKDVLANFEPKQEVAVDKVVKPKFSILNFLLDTGVLSIALSVDIVMNLAGFSILAYDPVSRVGFIACGLVVVLFALRAWLKGGWEGKVLWVIFATIAAFLDISLALASTDAQALHTYDQSKDSVYLSLKEKAEDDKKYLEGLRAKQLDLGEGYKSQIDNAVAQSNKSSEDFRNYRPLVDQLGGLGNNGLSSADIFNAIGNAAWSNRSERIVALIFWSALFIALQLTIISAASRRKL